MLLRISLSLIILLTAGNKSFSQIREFKMLLLEFTDNIIAGAYNEKFVYRRWRSRMVNAKNSRNVGRLLIRLEKNFNSGTMRSNWRNQQRHWENQLRNAESVSEIANALYRLEIGMNWSATMGGWQNRRRLWVKKIQTLY